MGRHGPAIQTVRETRPDAYVKVVASLLPRQVEAEVTGPTHEERVAEPVEGARNSMPHRHCCDEYSPVTMGPIKGVAPGGSPGNGAPRTGDGV